MRALTHRTSSCFLFELFVAQCILVKSGAEHSGEMRCILVKSDEFENSSHPIYFSQILIIELLARCARSAAMINVSNEGCLKKKRLFQRTFFNGPFSPPIFVSWQEIAFAPNLTRASAALHIICKWNGGGYFSVSSEEWKQKCQKKNCSRRDVVQDILQDLTGVKKLEKKERKHECTKRSNIGHYVCKQTG